MLWNVVISLLWAKYHIMDGQITNTYLKKKKKRLLMEMDGKASMKMK